MVGLRKSVETLTQSVERHTSLWLGGILALALVVRLISPIVIHQPSYIDGDAIEYDGIARSLLEGKGYAYLGLLTARRAPLYPLFLAGMHLLFGENAMAVAVVQAIIDTVSCYLVYLIAMEVFESSLTAVFSALLYSLYFPGVKFVGAVLTETMTVFLLLVFVLTLLRALETSDWKLFLLSGMAVGLTSLCRPTTLLLPFFLILLLPISLKRKGRNVVLVRNLGVLIIGTVMMMSPWVVRNYHVFGSFVPGTSLGGAAFYVGNHPISYGFAEETIPTEKTWHSYHRLMVQAGPLPEDEIGQGKMLFRLGIENLKEYSVWQIMYIVTSKLINSFMNWDFKRIPLLSIAYLVVNGCLLLFAFVGIFALRGEKLKRGWALVGVILYFILIHTVIVSGFRYNFPVIPYVIMFAASGVVYLYTKKFSREQSLRGASRDLRGGGRIADFLSS